MSSLRTTLLLSLCLATFVAVSRSQTPPTFTNRFFPAAQTDLYPGALAADVNNDGIQDIVEILNIPGALTGAEFTVQIANGHGSFSAPASPTIITTAGLVNPAAGDFNNDGKVDLVFSVSGTNQLVIFLGNGDGTFCAGRTITVALPAQDTFVQVVAADFNEDHKLDLMAFVLDATNTGNFYVLPGDGAGNFGAPQLAYAPPAGDNPGFLTLGDFDGDGHADIATESSSFSTCHGLSCPLTLHVLFGDGNLHFQDTSQETFPAGFGFAAGDLNGDGISDLYGFARDYIGKNNEQTNKLLIYYGSKSGAMALGYTLPMPGLEDGGMSMADFNGDGRMDIVVAGGQCCLAYDKLIFFLANGSGGYTPVDHAIPTQAQAFDVFAGQFRRGTRPDVVTIGQSSSSPNPTLIEAVNTTASGFWGGCAYPGRGEGIEICAPREESESASVHFRASANSYGLLEKIELWVDGKKVGEQYHAWENRAWFDQKIKFTPGKHHGAFVRRDIDSRSQVRWFEFTVTAHR